MLTTDEIKQAITHRPSRMAVGRAMFLQHRENEPVFAGEPVEHGPEGRRFAADLVKAMSEHVEAEKVYNHPGANVRASLRKDGPLTPSELSWLDRLPDPSQVTFDDAVTLAGLARTVSSMEHPSDARLIASHWTPVREKHDRLAAQTELDNARRPPVQIPASLVAAHSEALRHENPDLHEGDAVTRAHRELGEIGQQRAAAHERRLEYAKNHIADLDAATADRLATVK